MPVFLIKCEVEISVFIATAGYEEHKQVNFSREIPLEIIHAVGSLEIGGHRITSLRKTFKPCKDSINGSIELRGDCRVHAEGNKEAMEKEFKKVVEEIKAAAKELSQV